jgi:Ran GTPase-activating protein (RanGAP) involved in mRNA processing and transport
MQTPILAYIADWEVGSQQCELLSKIGLHTNETLQILILEGKTELVGACLDCSPEEKKARFKVGQDIEDVPFKAQGSVLVQDRGAQSIARVLRTNNTLTELTLNACEITDVGAISIGKALKKNRGLTALHLDHNRIGVQGATAIFMALRVNDVLLDLRLRGNRIEDEGALCLASIFNPSLVPMGKVAEEDKASETDAASQHNIVHVEDDETEDASGVDDDEHELFTPVICSLVHVDISLNQVTDMGASAIITSLGDQHKLQYFDASGRDFDLWGLELNIGIPGACAMGRHLPLYTPLHWMNISGVPLDLFQIRSSSKVELSNIHLHDEDVCLILPLLAANKHLANLDLSHNLLTDFAIMKLVGALSSQHSPLLRHVQLQGNTIYDHVADELGDLLAVNTTLLEIQFHQFKIQVQDLRGGVGSPAVLDFRPQENDGTLRVFEKRILAKLLKENLALRELNTKGLEDLSNSNRRPENQNAYRIGCWTTFKPPHGSLMQNVPQDYSKAKYYEECKIEIYELVFLGVRLHHSHCIRELCLTHANIDDEGATALAFGVELHMSLRTLDLSHNKIKVQGAKAIRQALERNMVIEHISLGHNLLGSEGSIEVCRACERNMSIMSLHLTSNQIEDWAMCVLGISLAKNYGLTDVDLRWNEVLVQGAFNLAKCLRIHPTLKKLDIEDANMGVKGALYMASAMLYNTTLTTLTLAGDVKRYPCNMKLSEKDPLPADMDSRQANRELPEFDFKSIGNMPDGAHGAIGGAGGAAFGRVLADNTTLISLNLNETVMFPEGGECLAIGLARNSTLVDLKLDHCALKTRGACAIANALGQGKNTSLKFLSVRYNDMECAGCMSFMEDCLASNSTLTSLDLGYNRILDSGAKIASAFVPKFSKSFVYLGLNGNEISHGSAKHLLDVEFPLTVDFGLDV